MLIGYYIKLMNCCIKALHFHYPMLLKNSAVLQHQSHWCDVKFKSRPNFEQFEFTIYSILPIECSCLV